MTKFLVDLVLVILAAAAIILVFPFLLPFLAPLAALGTAALVIAGVLAALALVLGAVFFVTVIAVKILLLGTAAAILAGLFLGNSVNINGPGIAGDGKVIEENRQVEEYRAIQVNGAYELEIECQKENSLTIRADQNLVPLIETVVSDQTLFIRSTKRISNRGELKLLIGIPYIEKLSINGAAKAFIRNSESEKLDLEINGAGKIMAEGKTGALTVSVAGAADVNADGLKADVASVELNGAGRVGVRAVQVLNVDISGAGVVDYYGDPLSINKSVSGMGIVRRKAD